MRKLRNLKAGLTLFSRYWIKGGKIREQLLKLLYATKETTIAFKQNTEEDEIKSIINKYIGCFDGGSVIYIQSIDNGVREELIRKVNDGFFEKVITKASYKGNFTVCCFTLENLARTKEVILKLTSNH